jgi:allantoinase
LNYAWRDYGNRVGAWRILALLDQLALPASVIANSAMYPYAPALMAAFRARGDEVVGHGRTNSERQSVLDELAECELIAVITAAEGKPPTGWPSPWIAESNVTPDLLELWSILVYGIRRRLFPRLLERARRCETSRPR